MARKVQPTLTAKVAPAERGRTVPATTGAHLVPPGTCPSCRRDSHPLLTCPQAAGRAAG